jgi:hypothetical protein
MAVERRLGHYDFDRYWSQRALYLDRSPYLEGDRGKCHCMGVRNKAERR